MASQPKQLAETLDALTDQWTLAQQRAMAEVISFLVELGRWHPKDAGQYPAYRSFTYLLGQ